MLGIYRFFIQRANKPRAKQHLHLFFARSFAGNSANRLESAEFFHREKTANCEKGNIKTVHNVFQALPTEPGTQRFHPAVRCGGHRVEFNGGLERLRGDNARVPRPRAFDRLQDHFRKFER